MAQIRNGGTGTCRRLICLSFVFVLCGSFFSAYKGYENNVTTDEVVIVYPRPQMTLQKNEAADSTCSHQDDRLKPNITQHVPTLHNSVSTFKDPSTWCRTNSFVSSWSSSKFMEAAMSVIEYRSTIVHRTHEKTWNSHLPDINTAVTHTPYDSLPNVVPCVDEVYTDADAKVICGISRLQAPCVIYSLGSDGNFVFEEAVSKKTRCEIHTFDCTVSKERLPAILPARVTYHSICVGSDEEVTSKYRSLGSLMREFGHKRVDLLKMDIEGFEYRVVEAMYGSFLKEGGKNLPLQIAFEQHFITGSPSHLSWSGKNPGLSAGDMAIIWVDLSDMGYVLTGRNDNPGCPSCSELSAMRVFCEV
jgi:hypothetical protein